MTCLSAGVDDLGMMTLCPVSGGNRFCVQPVGDLAAAPPKLMASSTASFWSLPRTDRADPLRVATFSALRPYLCPPPSPLLTGPCPRPPPPALQPGALSRQQVEPPRPPRVTSALRPFRPPVPPVRRFEIVV